MRIVYLINGLNGGGAAFPMIRVIGLMRELGHEVTVLALMPQDGKAAARLEAAGIPYAVIGVGVYDILAPAVRLIRELRARRPQLIWTSLTRGTIYGQLIGRMLGVPVVSWQHSAFLKRGNVVLLRCTLGFTSRWVADSDAVNQFAQAALGVTPEKISTWAPFVADAAAPVSSPWRAGEPLRIGTLGRLHPSKQYDVLLRAFARANELDPDVAARLRLHIAGDGPDEGKLESLARQLGIDAAVQFHGFIEQPAQFLAQLHGYVQTSLKEGFCIAAHEAMLAGLPVIATRVGELVRSIQPGSTGWLCDVGDVDSLAQALLALARDPQRAARMGLAARSNVLDRFSRSRFQSAGRELLARIQRELQPCEAH